MAVVLAAVGFVLYARVGSHLDVALNHQLELRAHDLAAVAQERGEPLLTAPKSPFVEQGESYAQLVDQRGRVLDASRPLGKKPLLTRAQVDEGLRRRFFLDRPSVPGLDEPSRMLVSPIVKNHRRLVLVVGTTKADRIETLGSLRNELAIAGPLALLLATLAGYLLAGVALRPVEHMRARAEEISAETPGERLPVPHTRDEVERLGHTLNEMLERLEAALERERDFVADAGHELRTPLALLRAELELALRHAETPEELREAVARSSDEVDRLAQLADHLLLIARTDRGTMPVRLEPLAADELLGTIASRFEWRAEEAERPIRIEPAVDVVVCGDRLRLEQALGNLVDNALRHGAGSVSLSAAQRNGVVELHVGDEGGGFPPQFLEQAFERFSRHDQARSRGGAGLGLAIVRAIAEAHGGGAHASNTGSGADVWVELPASE
jgi:signal transduction histidine kinase